MKLYNALLVLNFDSLIIFHNILACPETTVHHQVKYILMMCRENSTTWSNHLKLLCLKYGLPDPLQLMETESAWNKEKWKCLVNKTFTVHFEKELRIEASTNSSC